MSFAGQQPQAPSKKVGETGVVTFDFVSVLQLSESISSAVVTASVYSGVDPAPSSLISSFAVISGSVVTQKLTGGVVGTIYTLLCTITTSVGFVNTYQMSSLMAVVPAVV